jgi:hypothetical protein
VQYILTAVQCILGGNAASVEESQSGNLDCLALYLATLDRTDSTARISARTSLDPPQF